MPSSRHASTNAALQLKIGATTDGQADMKNTLAFLFSPLILAAPSAFPDELVIPRGTVVFGELGERVTSNSNDNDVGDEVDGQVWKDVIVEGHTVIRAGTPIALRITQMTSSGVGGRGGSLKIMAVSVNAIDGTEISLAGGYDQAAGDRYALNQALAYVLWPSVFLPGRKAVLDVGTVFDASIPADTRIMLPESAVPTLKLADVPDFSVEVVYDEINQRAGTLPLALTLCNREFTRQASITTVNDKEVRPILVTIITSRLGNPCHEYRAIVNLESLTKEFNPGINRFSVAMGGTEAGVVLYVEM
jgi:hypothetical protein